jgi:hypothetical protein
MTDEEMSEPMRERRRHGRGTSRPAAVLRAVLALVVVLALALVSAGCGGGGDGPPTPTARPSSPAKVTIESPTNGESFPAGTEIPVKVQLTGAKIVKQTTKNITPTTGHLHLLVDNAVVSMNYATTETLKGVEPGMHVMKVEFVAADHLPFDPRVISAVTFEVKR